MRTAISTDEENPTQNHSLYGICYFRQRYAQSMQIVNYNHNQVTLAPGMLIRQLFSLVLCVGVRTLRPKTLHPKTLRPKTLRPRTLRPKRTIRPNVNYAQGNYDNVISYAHIPLVP